MRRCRRSSHNCLRSSSCSRFQARACLIPSPFGRGERNNKRVIGLVSDTLAVTVSPSPQSKDEENEKLHKLREYARDFRRQHTTDAEQFDWDSDDGDYGLAIGRLVVT
jgi:hypothetical protein